MANVISYDLAILSEAKTEYESYAGEIQGLMEKIDRLVSGKLAEGWRGASYDAFMEQNQQVVKPAFDKMTKALNDIGQQIKTAVDNATAADNASKVM